MPPKNTTSTDIIDDFKKESLTPRTSPYLLSHLEAEEEFFKLLKADNLHHSWIITGEKGIGKATLAYRIIRYIFSSSNNSDIMSNLNLELDTSISSIASNDNSFLDDSDDEEESEYTDTDFSFEDTNSSSLSAPAEKNIQNSIVLNELDTSPLKHFASHPIFERLLAGGLTDLKVITREYSDSAKTKLKSEISIDQIRDLKEFFSKTSSEGGYKIALIDSLDEMNPKSTNALLKILEEAPNKSLLLLICNNYEALLDTIKSRCRILKLLNLNDDTMQVLLSEYIPNISEDDIAKLIMLSSGSIGTALNFYKSDGLTILDTFNSIIPDFLNKKNKRLLELTSLIGNSEIKFKVFQKILITFINKLIKLNSNVSVSFSSKEEEQALCLAQKYFLNTDKLFKIREEVLKNFELTPILNLDTTAAIITCFERLKNAY